MPSQENSDLRPLKNSDPLGVLKTQTPEELIPSRCIKNSDPQGISKTHTPG